MTLQNRVTPFGVFEADPARGTLMGNRGCLVDATGELVRRWQLERWITCVLEFKRRRRHPLFAPGQYTELFFLDEATACAACAELPDGAIVSLDGRAWIVLDGGLRAWTHAGYTDHRPSPAQPVSVLTPPSTLAAMRAGWRPSVHRSARP
jgi:hypothetical protein